MFWDLLRIAREADSTINGQNESIAKLTSECDEALREVERLNRECKRLSEGWSHSTDLGMRTLHEWSGKLEAEQQAHAKTKAKLADVQHCYEQCEIDRQALAKERDEARKECEDLQRTATAFIEDYQVREADRDEKHAARVNALTARIVAARAALGYETFDPGPPSEV